MQPSALVGAAHRTAPNSIERGSYRMRCPNCRTRRTDPHSMFLHLLHCKQEDCTCGGYHFKHRRGSPLCVGNPRNVVRAAECQGATEEELRELEMEIAFTTPGQRWQPCEPIPL